MDYAEVYFAVASISTILVACFLLSCLLSVFSILRDIKKLSNLARREAEIIAKGVEKGVEFLPAEFSRQTAGFIKAVFALLLSHFAPRKSATRRINKVEKI